MLRDKDRYSRSERYEYILDDGEDYTRWSDVGIGTSENLTYSTRHITGQKSISFDKKTGGSTLALWRTFSSAGMDMNAFAAEGQLYFSVYLPSLTNVVSVEAYLFDTGANFLKYSVLVADLTTGWNNLKVNCNDGVQSGTGVNWYLLKKIGIGATFSSSSATLAGILLDSVRFQVPSATYTLDHHADNILLPTTSGITTLVNGGGSSELSVVAEDSAHVSGVRGLVPLAVRNDTLTTLAGTSGDYIPFSTDGSGRLLSSGINAIANGVNSNELNIVTEDEAHSSGVRGIVPLAVRNDTGAALANASGDYIPLTTDSFGRLTTSGINVIRDGAASNELSVVAEDSVHTSGVRGIVPLAVRNDTGTVMAADGDYIPLMVNSMGKLAVTGSTGGVSGGGTAGGMALYMSSSGHFTTAYYSATVVSLYSLPVPVAGFYVFESVVAFDNSRNYINTYMPTTHNFSWDDTNKRLTVTGAAFTSAGTILVSYWGPDRTISLPTNAQMVRDISPYQLYGDDTMIPLVASAQTITGSWADFGPEIPTYGYNKLKIWLTLDVNDSINVRVRVLEKHTAAGADEYSSQIENIGTTDIKLNAEYWEIDTDADQKLTIPVPLDGATPYIQVQITAGTAGASAGTIIGGYTRSTFGG